jgi:hypothetical protein
MNIRAKLVGAVALALLAGTACDSSDQDATSAPETPAKTTPSEPPSAWDKVLDQIGPKGEVSVDTAVAAFSLAYGPLPGAKVPSGPDEAIPSGTMALRWLYAKWDQLTPQQRQAASRYLEAPPLPAAGSVTTVRSTTSGSAPATPVPAGCRTDDTAVARSMSAEANRIKGIVAERMDVEPTFTIAIKDGQNRRVRAEYDAQPLDADCEYRPGVMAYCTIRYYGNVRTDLDAIRTILAHEVVHCFQEQLLGVTGWEPVPDWIIEGQATWGALSIHASDAYAGEWEAYLKASAEDLFGRAYDAVGFYAHLAETGGDPWKRLKPMLLAAARGNNVAAWHAALAKVDQKVFLDSWPSGYFREGNFPWNTTGPGITADRPEIQVIDEGSFPQPAYVAATLQKVVEIDSQVIQISGPFGRFMDAKGADYILSQMGGVNFCTIPDGCECPEGSPNEDVSFHPMAAGPARVAATGGLEPGTVDLNGMTLDKFCGQQCPTATSTLDPNGPGGVETIAASDETCEPPPCPTGRWVATDATVDSDLARPVSGGAGALLTVDESGDIRWDLNPSEKFVAVERTSAGRLVMHLKLRGHATGHIDTSPGDRMHFRARGTASLAYRVLSPIAMPWRTVDISGAGGVRGWLRCDRSMLRMSWRTPSLTAAWTYTRLDRESTTVSTRRPATFQRA